MKPPIRLLPSLHVLALALAWGIPALVRAGTDGTAPDPVDQLRQSVEAVLQVLQDPQLDRDTKADRIEALVRERFDFRAMAQRTLAADWRRATPEQRQRFEELFTRLLRNTYVGRIDSYHNEQVEYGRARIDGRFALVDTVVVSGAERIPIQYRMYLRDGRWLVYDVIIEDVSLINTYRSNYRAIIRKEGIEGLLARMAEQAGGKGRQNEAAAD